MWRYQGRCGYKRKTSHSFHVCAYIHMCVSECLYVCMSVCLYVCMSVCLYVCLSVCLSDGWTGCLSDLHIPYQVEPRHHYNSTGNRPDITIFDIKTEQTLDLDISLAHPWSVDNVKRASRIDRFAPVQGKIRKRQNTLNTNNPGVVSRNVSLLCSNILVVGVRKFLSSSTNSRKNQNVVQFKRHWRKRLSIILRKCNARVLLKKFIKT